MPMGCTAFVAPDVVCYNAAVVQGVKLESAVAAAPDEVCYNAACGADVVHHGRGAAFVAPGSALPAHGGGRKITLQVHYGGCARILVIRCKTDTPMGWVMDRAVRRFGLEAEASQVIFEATGREIAPADTAEKLGLRDTSLIRIVHLDTDSDEGEEEEEEAPSELSEEGGSYSSDAW